ncbi:MAG: hypothetical protein IT581_02075 [Verrucomicrobiales bacterium]|nr:hypothetical protein [Verrucomicrobiales bacterium]
MDASILLWILLVLLASVPFLRMILHPSFRRSSPRARYTVFRWLLILGISINSMTAVMSVVNRRPGIAMLALLAAAATAGACLVEMRRLRRKF